METLAALTLCASIVVRLQFDCCTVTSAASVSWFEGVHNRPYMLLQQRSSYNHTACNAVCAYSCTSMIQIVVGYVTHSICSLSELLLELTVSSTRLVVAACRLREVGIIAMHASVSAL